MLRRLVFIYVLVLSSSSLFAQFEKGSLMVGGNVSANFSTSTIKSGLNNIPSYSIDTYSFQPRGGYFFIDNLVGGVGITYSNTKQTYTNTSLFSTTISIIVAPYLRYYLKKFYVEGSIGFGSTKYENNYSSSAIIYLSQGNENNWTLVGGYSILINKHVAIEPQFGFQKSTQTNNDSNTIIDKSGYFFQLGFQFYIFHNNSTN